MKVYRKPSCISQENIQGIVPLAVAAAAIGASAEAVSVASVAGAALIGAAAGLGGKDFSSLDSRAMQEQIVY